MNRKPHAHIGGNFIEVTECIRCGRKLNFKNHKGRGLCRVCYERDRNPYKARKAKEYYDRDKLSTA
jgi:hypothetical protein